MRLDQYLVVHHGITRNKSQQLIKSGLVTINAKICNKSAFAVSDGVIVAIIQDRRVGWVSRSAEKLAGFIETHADIIIEGKNCLDVGSSTGGFTQVLLGYGAAHVDAVDVGTDQIHPSIRSDSRVVSYEQTDIRDFSQKTPYDIIVCDASFISLSQIFDPIIGLAMSHTDVILLFKPQFEVGKENLRKTGVPKDERSISIAMQGFESLIQLKNCQIMTKEKSCLIGEAGNQEWVYWIKKM